MKKAGRFYSLTEKGKIYYDELSKALENIEKRLNCSKSKTSEVS